jgi:hypothetical protein
LLQGLLVNNIHCSSPNGRLWLLLDLAWEWSWLAGVYLLARRLLACCHGRLCY